MAGASLARRGGVARAGSGERAESGSDLRSASAAHASDASARATLIAAAASRRALGRSGSTREPPVAPPSVLSLFRTGEGELSSSTARRGRCAGDERGGSGDRVKPHVAQRGQVRGRVVPGHGGPSGGREVAEQSPGHGLPATNPRLPRVHKSVQCPYHVFAQGDGTPVYHHPDEGLPHRHRSAEGKHQFGLTRRELDERAVRPLALAIVLGDNVSMVKAESAARDSAPKPT